MADIELFNQPLTTAPAGAELTDRIAVGKLNGTTKNITWSALITWLGTVLPFLKGSENLNELTDKPLALSRLGGLSATTATATYATIANQNILANKMGGLIVQISASVNSNGALIVQHFANSAWSSSKVSTGRYRIAHNLGTLYVFVQAMAVNGGSVIGFTSVERLDANNIDLYFSDVTNLRDTIFEFVLYTHEGW